MSPEYSWIVKANLSSGQEAAKLQQAIGMFSGVEIIPLSQEMPQLSSAEGGEIDFTVPVGKIVKLWRDFRGLTATALAIEAGVSKAYLSEVETGRILRPREARLKLIADALGIPIENFITRKLPPEQSAQL